MNDLNDFLKHLRSVHFVFVIAAAAIFIALSGSNTIYDEALEQQRDVIRLREILTSRYIGDSIRGSAGNRSPTAGGRTPLVEFISESFVEYLEAIGVDDTSVEVRFVSTEIPDGLGYIGESEPRGDRWFDQSLCLLSDGDNHHRDYDGAFIYHPKNVAGFRSAIEDAAKTDTLYIDPEFNGTYHTALMPAHERHAKLSDEIRDRLNRSQSVSLSIKLTGINLTDTQDRKVYADAKAHAEDSPIAYESYEFEFDTLLLSCRATLVGEEGQPDPRSAVEFEQPLPVMFTEREAQFFRTALKHPSIGGDYLPRYLSGARSFDRLFPELSSTTKNLNSLSTDDLELHLEEQRLIADAPIELLGIQIGRDLIQKWGVLLMLCVQLYLCMHYRALVRLLAGRTTVSFPWIGLYRERAATVLFQVSVALPLAICLFILLRDGIGHAFKRPVAITTSLAAAGLLAWIEVLYWRERRTDATSGASR